MTLKKLIKISFNVGNTCVTGLRGCGKDMLFANVVARRNAPYVSNMDYHVKNEFIPLNFSNLDVHNDYRNFIDGNFNAYQYPYPENVDIYVSDVGVYFPSQYCSELNRKYPEFPVFMALSRHLGDCNFHFNVQNLNRAWDKLREQSDIYILTRRCRVLGKLVFQKITIYDKYQSCVDRVKPYQHIKPPLGSNRQVRAEYLSRDRIAFNQFCQNYGEVKNATLIYFNKSKYDTRLFKSLLGGDLCVS